MANDIIDIILAIIAIIKYIKIAIINIVLNNDLSCFIGIIDKVELF